MRSKSRSQSSSLWQAVFRAANWPPIQKETGRRALLETKRNILRKLEQRLVRRPCASP
jgi:hypothetical protein